MNNEQQAAHAEQVRQQHALLRAVAGRQYQVVDANDRPVSDPAPYAFARYCLDLQTPGRPVGAYRLVEVAA